MSNLVKVMLRDRMQTKQVVITSSDKPMIEEELLEKWQRIINLISRIIDVPATLLMRITEDSMKVFIKSQNIENPYVENGEDSLGHGLYCETVIGVDKDLLVKNALESPTWKDNPDVKLNMISYYGLPIKWPDEEFFGTLCILDDKENAYNDDFKDLMKEFKVVIESDLKSLLQK